jgi:lipopolysaccharide transport protein LptA
VLVVLLAMAVAPVSLAEPPKPAPAPAPKEKAEPVRVVADKLDIDLEAKSAVLSGNVRLERGTMKVRAPRFDVRYDEVPNVVWAKGTGGVVAEVKGAKAEAPEVEIDLKKQSLALRGGVRLTRGEGWIKAEQATIDMASGKVALTGVEGVLTVP